MEYNSWLHFGCSICFWWQKTFIICLRINYVPFSYGYYNYTLLPSISKSYTSLLLLLNVLHSLHFDVNTSIGGGKWQRMTSGILLLFATVIQVQSSTTSFESMLSIALLQQVIVDSRCNGNVGCDCVQQVWLPLLCITSFSCLICGPFLFSCLQLRF